MQYIAVELTRGNIVARNVYGHLNRLRANINRRTHLGFIDVGYVHRLPFSTPEKTIGGETEEGGRWGERGEEDRRSEGGKQPRNQMTEVREPLLRVLPLDR